MPDISSFPSRDQLDRYLAGELPPDERARVAQWIARDDRRCSTVEAIKHLDRPREATDRDPLGSRWAQMAHRIISPQAVGTGKRVPHWQRPSWTSVLQPAIGLVVCVIVGVAAWRLSSDHLRHTPATPLFSRAERVYETRTGQRATITLGDGSRVTLAPQTTLRIARDFGTTSRTVSLTGEAYFEVTNASRAPFTVRTGNVSTHVLGTAFVVKQYASDIATRVVVAEGKVQSVGSSRAGLAPTVVLTSGMIGMMTDSTATATRAGDVSTYTAWTRGHLDFDNAPITDVLATMERWYGLRFRLADSSLVRETVTGSLDFHTTSAALNYLQSLLGVQMTFEYVGDTTVVTLRPRSTTAQPRLAPRDGHPFKFRTEVGR